MAENQPVTSSEEAKKTTQQNARIFAMPEQADSTPPPSPEAPAPFTSPAQHESINDRMSELRVSKKGFPWKPIVLVLAIVAVVAAAFLLSMKIFDSRTPATPDSPSVAEEAAQADIKTEFKTEETAEETAPAEDLALDTDKDGLTDAREAELRTDPTNEDTDADGLSDREEVEIYKTNPFNPDTDGDGFTDGAEVEAGYNPIGGGTLLKLPSAEDEYVALCESFEGDEKDICIWDMAKEQLIDGLCEKMTIQDWIIPCQDGINWEIAERGSNETSCNKIQDEGKRSDCIESMSFYKK